MRSTPRVPKSVVRGSGARVAITAAFAVCLACLGCATAPATDPLASAFDAQGVAHARTLAPDLYGRALQARREAMTATEREVRAGARARAELWLQAALVEAQRIDQQRAASAADTRTVEAEAARLVALRERTELERELAFAEAGRLARVRAERMLAGGALADAALRGDAAALAEATRFAVERAALLLSAARALGLSEARSAALAARLDALAVGTDASPRLRAVLELWSALELALGEARLARPGPTSQELASLRADAAERGLPLELSARGATLVLDAPVFASGRASLRADGLRVLAHVAAVLRLHPRGAVELEAGSSALASRRARALATRMRAVRTELRIVPAMPGSDGVVLVLRAYGTAAPSSTAP